MVNICHAETTCDLQGILDLQKENLLQNISDQEKLEQGFVRVQHSLDQLKMLNAIEPHIIGKDGDKIAAYFLAMTKTSRNDVPMLIPMFDQFDSLTFKGKKISESNYMAVGQVCIGKAYRGQGLFFQCYEAYRKAFESRYDFAITEISISNARSLKAHQKVGFEVIHTFKDEYETWAIVLWDWS
jgi:hypothetical protein